MKRIRAQLNENIEVGVTIHWRENEPMDNNRRICDVGAIIFLYFRCNSVLLWPWIRQQWRCLPFDSMFQEQSNKSFHQMIDFSKKNSRLIYFRIPTFQRFLNRPANAYVSISITNHRTLNQTSMNFYHIFIILVWLKLYIHSKPKHSKGHAIYSKVMVENCGCVCVQNPAY